MRTVYFYCVFKNDPLAIIISDSGKSYTKYLYQPGTKRSIYDVELDVAKISNLIIKLSSAGVRVVLNNYKNFITHFGLQNERPTNIYDIDVVGSGAVDVETKLQDGLNQLLTTEIQSWQNIRANALYAYVDIESRGIYVDDELQIPVWTLDLFSGRSRSSGFSVQNLTNAVSVINPAGAVDDIFINFDWVAADLRICSLMSQDPKLIYSYGESDPYTYLSEYSKTIPDRRSLTRDEAKTLLLATINSLGYNEHCSMIYPELFKWVKSCKHQLQCNGFLLSLLERKFVVDGNRTALSVINAIQQGSVAHAMQLTFKRIWDVIGRSLLFETHDSITITCPKNLVKELISTIVPIMLYPFKDVLENNPVFPIRVHIGTSYKNWKPYKTFRN